MNHRQFTEINFRQSAKIFFVLIFPKPHFFTVLRNLTYFSMNFMLTRLNIQHESIDLMAKLICWRNKQSLSSYRISTNWNTKRVGSIQQNRISPNGNRKHAGSIQQHFRFHWNAKCDGSLRNGPKSDLI